MNICTNKNKGIYKITNIVNNKIYIGSAAYGKGFYQRCHTHKCNLRAGKHCNKHLQAAWNKYGEDSFIFEIIETIDNLNIILEREQFYLDTLRPFDDTIGYNICKIAGNTLGVKLTDKQKRNLSRLAKLKTGDKNPFYGKLHTEEYKKIQSEMRKKQYSNNTHPRLGTKHSEETKRKQSEAKLGKTLPLKKIPVYQLLLNGDIIKLWDSASDAAKTLGISAQNITTVCKGKSNLKTIGGFKWKYA